MNRVPFSGILGPTYTLESLNAECQRCVNMLPERVESSNGKDAFWLKPTPGLELFCALPTGPVRRLLKAANGRVFAVANRFLYELVADGTYTLRGTMVVNEERVRMADNGLVLFIAVGSTLAYYLKYGDDTFHEVTDVNYLGGSCVEFLDQFLIVNRPDSQQFQLLPLAYDGSQPMVAADVFTAESSPDYVTSLVVNGRELWLFGPESYEVWWNTGDSLRTFQRIRDAAFNIGTVVLSLQGRVFWLGGSKEGHGIVWGSSGYQPVRVSDYGVEQLIDSFEYIDDAEAWTYQRAGHFMYALNFPRAGRTLVYDLKEDLWHEMEYRVPSSNNRTQHRASCHTFAFNRNLVGDFANGNVYELSSDVYTDNGDPIVRYRRAPHIQKKAQKVFYHYLDLDAEVGVGLVSGQGSNPLISLRFSDDGARTWGSYHTKSLGALGKYKTRVRWTRLGSSYDRVYEITVTDPVPFRIMGANLGLTDGAG
jgi:hypothetical protein